MDLAVPGWEGGTLSYLIDRVERWWVLLCRGWEGGTQS